MGKKNLKNRFSETLFLDTIIISYKYYKSLHAATEATWAVSSVSGYTIVSTAI